MDYNNHTVFIEELLERIKNTCEDIILHNCVIKECAYKHENNSETRLFGSKSDPINILRTIKLTHCFFETKVIFIDVIFRKHVTFEGSWFHEDVCFLDVTFQKGASFIDTNFIKKADFIGSIFMDEKAKDEEITLPCESCFNNTRFRGISDFSGCKFDKAQFSDAIFDEYVAFSKENFRNEVDFTHVIFKREPEFKKTGEREEDITEVMFEENLSPEIREIRTKTILSLGKAYLYSNLSAKAGYFFLRTGEAFKTIHNTRKDRQSYENALVNYRLAEDAYDSVKDQKMAGEAYKRAMDFKRKNQEDLGFLQKRWLCVLKCTSNYGESIWRFVISIILIVFAFAGIYLLPVIEYKKYPFHEGSYRSLYNIITAIYFSVVTFATLGFGDITPVNITGKLCAIAEVISGYIMFGVLLTLLARKIIR